MCGRAKEGGGGGGSWEGAISCLAKAGFRDKACQLRAGNLPPYGLGGLAPPGERLREASYP